MAGAPAAELLVERKHLKQSFAGRLYVAGVNPHFCCKRRSIVLNTGIDDISIATIRIMTAITGSCHSGRVPS